MVQGLRLVQNLRGGEISEDLPTSRSTSKGEGTVRFQHFELDKADLGTVYAYSPYGESTTLGPDDGNPIQYTGRENDGAGLTYYRARYYDSVMKRFVSEDPIGLEAGPNFYAYSPYGTSTTLGPDDGNPIQFTGRENDQTGLYYYRARYYDSVLKRFVSEDPIGLEAGPNFYAYVRNDPVNLVDPTGLRDVDVYVWNRSGTSVGHVMVTEAGRTTVILSQFPHGPGGESRPDGPNRRLTYDQTWREEARLPDRILRIHVPNDAAFDAAVANHIRRLEWNWLPTTGEQTHCARAAYDSLRAGGVPLAGQDRGQILPGTLGDLLLRGR